MRVLYDHQAFDNQHVGGISRYFAALIAGIPESSVALRYTDNLHIRSLERFAESLMPKEAEYARFMLGMRFRGKKRLYRAWNALLQRPAGANKAAALEALGTGEFDVFHPTYYDPYFLEHLNGKPFVLTIYDMIHEKFPEFFSLGEPTSGNKRMLAERADRIIAISEKTKRDIIDVFGIPGDRIDVVYLASDIADRAKGSLQTDLRGYVLYTGTRAAYKNFYFMVSAIAPLLREREGLRLVCSGPGFSGEEIEYFSSLGIEGKIIHRFVADRELHALYRDAACFVFPSYYEGFGLPVLEAFGAGCPVVLAEASCFREIAGDAALYFDPKDGNGMRSKILEILGDKTLASDLAKRGYERAGRYTWSETVKGTMTAYAKAIEDRGRAMAASRVRA